MLPLVLAAVLAFPAPLPVQRGDTVTLSGTNVACTVQAVGYLCYKSRAGRPRAGSYAVRLIAPGLAAIVQVTKELDLVSRVSKVAAGVSYRPGGRTTTVPLRPGGTVRLRISGFRPSLDCSVATSESRPSVYCSINDARGPVAGTFAIVLNDGFAALAKIEPSGRTTVTDVRRHPR